MSDLSPLLSELSRIIDKIDSQLGKRQHTKEEVEILYNLISRGLPVLGITYSATQLVEKLGGIKNL